MPVAKDVLIRLLQLFVRRPALLPEHVRSSSVRSILVIRQHDMLGDFLLATPAFRALRHRFPDARLGVLVRDYFADAVFGNPYVDEILVVRKGKHQWNPAGLKKLMTQLYKRWDMAVVLNTVSHSLSSDLLADLSARRFVLGTADRIFPGASRNFFYNLVAPASRQGTHQTERNLDIVRYIGAETDEFGELMSLKPGEIQEAWEALRRLGMREDLPRIAMHVGAGKVANRWPVARFAQLAQLLRERLGVQILLSWGPKEEHLAEEFCRLVSIAPIRVSPGSLRHLAACFTHCSLLVCNDTGVMHVCASVGVPLVAIFGPTHHAEWKPIGDAFVAVQGQNGSVDTVEVSQVFAEVAALFSRARMRQENQVSPSNPRILL